MRAGPVEEFGLERPFEHKPRIADARGGEQTLLSWHLMPAMSE